MVPHSPSKTWLVALAADLERLGRHEATAAEGRPRTKADRFTTSWACSLFCIGLASILSAVALIALAAGNYGPALIVFGDQPNRPAVALAVLPPGVAHAPERAAIVELPRFASGSTSWTASSDPQTPKGGPSKDDAKKELQNLLSEVGPDDRVVAVVLGTYDIRPSSGPSNLELAQGRARHARQWMEKEVFEPLKPTLKTKIEWFEIPGGPTDLDKSKSSDALEADRAARALVIVGSSTAAKPEP